MTTVLNRPPATEPAPAGTATLAPETVAPQPRAPETPAPQTPAPVTPAPDHSVAHRPADRAVSGTSRLELSGALTRADAPWLEPELERLAHGSAAVVEVELSDVPSMDAHVARLLLRTSWHLGDPARRLLLVHPQPLVHRVLRFYGAGDLVVRAPRPKGRRRS